MDRKLLNFNGAKNICQSCLLILGEINKWSPVAPGIGSPFVYGPYNVPEGFVSYLIILSDDSELMSLQQDLDET